MEEALEHIDSIIKYAKKVGINDEKCKEIDQHFKNNLTLDNLWCLYRYTSSGWLYHFLLINRTDRILRIEQINELEISQEAKNKIMSIIDCESCQKRHLDHFDNLYTLPKNAILYYLSDNAISSINLNILCKHYLISEQHHIGFNKLNSI